MDKTNRPSLFVVDGNEIVIPEPTEEQLLALAAERVSGKVTPQEFLEFPDVREAVVQLYKKQKLVEAKALIAAERAAKRQVLELARQKLMVDLANETAGVVLPAPTTPIQAPKTVTVMDETVVSKPLVLATKELVAQVVVRPPMPELGQGEVLSDYRALGIAQGEKDPQIGIAYRRFAKPEDLLRYKDSATGNWWCMVTGRLTPEDSIRVVGAVLVCEKSHAERLAKKVGQHPHSIRGTLDWLSNKADMLAKRSQSTKSTHPVSKKSPERLAEELAEKENIRAAVGEINSIDQMLTDGFKLLRMHQPDCWQFRCTQAMLSNIANGLITQFEAELPDRFPNRGSTAELQKELDSVLEKRRASNEKSFELFLFHRLAGVLIRHREALQRPMSAPGSVSRKKRPDKADKLAKEAKSRGIDTTGKTEAELRAAIATHERAKASRKGAKPGYGRRS